MSSPTIPQLVYLQLLSQQVPSIQGTLTASVNLTAQLYLPKGTEHFGSDIHGEYEAFGHVPRNGSGSIQRRMDEIFGDCLSESERRNLTTLIYYPWQKLPLILQTVDDEKKWYRANLLRFINVCRAVSSKYPRPQSKDSCPSSSLSSSRSAV